MANLEDLDVEILIAESTDDELVDLIKNGVRAARITGRKQPNRRRKKKKKEENALSDIDFSKLSTAEAQALLEKLQRAL